MKNVSVQDVPSDAQLIDCREDNEWNVDHAAGAVHIPLSEFVSRIDEIDLDRDVYLICKAGGRSLQAAEYLEQVKGITPVNVEGGTDAWREAGLPMEH
ncbi:rhodanese-like domain-containing protein [Corynebacterium suedekumii]|uniref:Rhodanese-like domain-containing protein n=1 Tax=Corynebacterium suedekumii TaxID=3049801 RepID=A0ABY8VM20_9CORY|nr:rhodanese-like domain-containing protein [Corynebacterium suedekumii]WIM70691.1 rhodanese-like domain-containing protein [Corynebacterium suedekumii]WIM71840.1 rhodanese-like domain-containing protein [Corynebacterium suedekumii]